MAWKAAAPPLRELGPDSATGKPIVLREGRFGPYVTDGETNASLRKGDTVDVNTPRGLRQYKVEAIGAKRRPAPKKAS